MLITFTILILSLAALVGVYLLSYVIYEKNTPKGVAIIHGSLGATGIVALLICSLSFPKLFFSLIFFIIAAVGGVILISLDIVGKKIPLAMAIGHGMVAILGFIMLVSIGLSYMA